MGGCLTKWSFNRARRMREGEKFVNQSEVTTELFISHTHTHTYVLMFVYLLHCLFFSFMCYFCPSMSPR